jgi:hypothetical protein
MILPQKALMDFNRYSIESLQDAVSAQHMAGGALSIQNSKMKGDQLGLLVDDKSDHTSTRTKSKHNTMNNQ